MKSPEAETYCVSRGYRLVEIYDQNQQDFIVDKATGIGSVSGSYGYWIGLKRIQGTSTWKWIDSDVIPEFTAWGPNHPKDSNAELLALSYNALNYKWATFTYHNTHNNNPICQLTTNTTTINPSKFILLGCQSCMPIVF